MRSGWRILGTTTEDRWSSLQNSSNSGIVAHMLRWMIPTPLAAQLALDRSVVAKAASPAALETVDRAVRGNETSPRSLVTLVLKCGVGVIAPAKLDARVTPWLGAAVLSGTITTMANNERELWAIASLTRAVSSRPPQKYGMH